MKVLNSLTVRVPGFIYHSHHKELSVEYIQFLSSLHCSLVCCNTMYVMEIE
jgi:hypothetical protein